jgi:starvation-inducible DNA-binding protein
MKTLQSLSGRRAWAAGAAAIFITVAVDLLAPTRLFAQGAEDDAKLLKAARARFQRLPNDAGHGHRPTGNGSVRGADERNRDLSRQLDRRTAEDFRGRADTAAGGLLSGVPRSERKITNWISLVVRYGIFIFQKENTVFETKNDLSSSIRVKAIDLLNARLADAVDLQTQIKQAHWNVKGPNFIALHELFDKINEDVVEYVDDLAERAVQLGGGAEGTARVVAQRSTLSEYPGAVEGRRHVEALSSVLAAFGKSARQAIDSANELHDLDTADLFTELSRGIDKWLWFVEAHLQSPS